MVGSIFPGGGDDDHTNPHTNKSEQRIKSEIDKHKQPFRSLDFEESKDELYWLAKELSELNEALAMRRGEDPTADEFTTKADRWSQIAKCIENGEDPREAVKSGPEQESDTDEDVAQFRQGTPEKTFGDVGGYSEVKEELREKAIKFFKHREFLSEELNQSVINGVIIEGPSGTGKTLMCQAFAGELNNNIEDSIELFKVSPNQLKRGVRGESGELMRTLFSAAQQAQPAVIIFEEIDSLAQDRTGGGVQMMRSDRDLVNSLLEEINKISSEDVIIMGTTNLIDDIDPAVIGDHRLDTMKMGLPDYNARRDIFKTHIRNIPRKHRSNFNTIKLAEKTEGFAGATIAKVVNNAILQMGIEYKEDTRESSKLTQQDILQKIEKQKE